MGASAVSRRIRSDAKWPRPRGRGFGEQGDGDVRRALNDNERRTPSGGARQRRMFRKDGLLK